VLICADAIRPSLDWLLRFAPARHNFAAEMARIRDPAAFAELTALCQGRVGLHSQQQALTNIAIIMAVKDGNVPAVEVGDCLQPLATAAATSATNDRHAAEAAQRPDYYLLRHVLRIGPHHPQDRGRFEDDVAGLGRLCKGLTRRRRHSPPRGDPSLPKNAMQTGEAKSSSAPSRRSRTPFARTAVAPGVGRRAQTPAHRLSSRRQTSGTSRTPAEARASTAPCSRSTITAAPTTS